MNWKALATRRLRQYGAMKASLENLSQELSLPCKPKMRHALEQRLSNTRCWVETVERGLSALNEEQRQVLELLYIDPRPNRLAALCAAQQREQSTIYRRRDTALERFTAALFGTPEA